MEITDQNQLFKEIETFDVDDHGVLDEPIEAFSALQTRDGDWSAAQWCGFNPLGPTLAFLGAWDDIETNTRLLGVTQIHPFEPRIIIYAWGAKQKLVNLTALLQTIGRMLETHDVES